MVPSKSSVNVRLWKKETSFLFPELKWELVPARPRVSSRWQTQLSFGLESKPLAGRYPDLEELSKIQFHPVHMESAEQLQGFWKCLPARANSVLFPGSDGHGFAISPLPPKCFVNKGNGLLRGGEGQEEANLSSQALLAASPVFAC